MPQDPYAAIAQPVAADPYASIAKPVVAMPNADLTRAAGAPKPSLIQNAPEESGLETGPLLSHNPAENDSLTHGGASSRTLARMVHSAGQALNPVTQIPAMFHAAIDKPENAQQANEEQGVAAAPMGGMPPILSRFVYRTMAKPALNAVQDYSAGKVTPEAALENAPEALGGAAGTVVGGKVLDNLGGAVTKGLEKSGLGPKPPIVNDLTAGAYSPAGDKIAASMRSNSAVDLPAEAHSAMPALKEAAADRGITAADFKGRNGPTAYQAVNKHALDITEARAKLAIDPVRDTEVLPETLAKNPALAAQFSPEELKRGLTIDDIDAKRVALNKQLRTSNFYSKAPSAQYAVADPMAAIHDAADQARTLVYDTASKATGVDLRPLKSTESSLIKLNDVANSTKNTLAEQTAKQNAAPMLQKIVGGAKRLIAIKANPTNAFEPGIVDPTADFNRNMQSAFSDVKASPGSVMKNGRLLEAGPGVLTKPPGVTPPEVNRQLPLTLEPNAPSYELTPPGGKTPPEIQPRQAAIPLEHGYHDVPGKDLHLTPPPPGEVGPTPLQNLLDFSREAHPTSQAGVPKSLGAAAAEPSGTPVPDILKPALNAAGEVTWPDSYKNPPKGGGGNYGPSDLDALKKRMGLTSEVGAERRTNPRNVLMSPAEIEAAIKNRMPVTTPFDMTEGANETIKNDPLMPRHPSELLQGGHAGNGVSSVEELSRPGANYVVDGHGKLTFHGKSFAPEETPVGSAHVTVLPDGELRINEGNLTPQMTAALRDGLKK